MTTVEQWVSLTDTTYENPYVEGVRQLAFTGVQRGKLSREQAAWMIEEARSSGQTKTVTMTDLGLKVCAHCDDLIKFTDSEWHTAQFHTGPICHTSPTGKHEPK